MLRGALSASCPCALSVLKGSILLFHALVPVRSMHAKSKSVPPRHSRAETSL